VLNNSVIINYLSIIFEFAYYNGMPMTFHYIHLIHKDIVVYTFNIQYPLCIIFGNNDRETYNIWFQRHPIIINYIVARYHNDETEWEKNLIK